MTASSSWTDSRYAGICIRPRATIRSVVDRDPRDKVVALVLINSLIGPVWNLIHSYEPPASDAYRIGGRLVHVTIPHFLWLVIWPLGAFLLLYLNGALIRWTGSLLGGTGRAVEVRAALAWPAVVRIVTAPVALLYGHMLFALGWKGWALPPGVFAHWHWTVPGIIVVASFEIWHFVISVECIAEVHRFSSWRGLAAKVLGFIGFIILVVLLGIANALLAVAIRLLK